jgi:hypothetical protein
MTPPGHSDSAEPTSRYAAVFVSDRLFSILGKQIEVDELDEFTYEWRRGYEVVTARREGGGSLEYRGVYHPGDGSCVGTGICR